MTTWAQKIPDCSVGPGMADVSLAAIGGRGPLVFEASEIGVSTEEDQPSTMLADFPLADLISQYDPIDGVNGRWARWYGGSLDTWTGVAVAVDGSQGVGSVQVSFEDFSTYLATRLLPNSQKTITGTAGGVVDVLVKYAEAADTLWLTGLDLENSGDLISYTMNGQSLRGALQEVAQMSGQHWRMADRALVWRADLGRDLTRSVQLNEGVEIASVRPTWDIGNVVNDVTVVPDKDVYAKRFSRRVVNVASVQAIFVRQGTITAADAVRPSAIRTIGKHSLAKSRALGRTLSLDLVNVNECFARFRTSDVIRVVIPSFNLAADLKVLQFSWALSTGVGQLVGELTS